MNNGHPTNKILTIKGVWQGEPFSLYLFILISQNLTTILNYAMRIHMILWFISRLNYNFNHLMYVADLIIIIKNSRKVVGHYRTNTSIYTSLTIQIPNNLKSTVYLPKWFNNRVAKSIVAFLISTLSFPLHLLRHFYFL